MASRESTKLSVDGFCWFTLAKLFPHILGQILGFVTEQADLPSTV